MEGQVSQLHHDQKNVALEEQFPGNSATVLYRLNVLQRVKGDQVTFRDVATTVLNRESSQSRRIDIVFDTYKENPIMNSKKSLRDEVTSYKLQGIPGT